MRALFLILLLAAAGCSLFDVDRTFVMGTVPPDAPPTATAGESLDVRVTGVLTNGCQAFERLEAEVGPMSVLLTMIGTEPARPPGCTDDIRYVERTYRVVPSTRGPFVVYVRSRPSGVLHERTVLVE
jgi:hypothetical protein